MNTPWGNSDYQKTLTRGLTIVGTPRHGGVMVSEGFAKNNLSISARERAIKFGGYYAFEEDCDMAMVIFELPEYFVREDKTLEEVKESALKSLSGWNADYLLEIGVEPSLQEYEFYKSRILEDEMRKNNHPDLVVACWGDWYTKIPDIDQVATADGREYYITKESYDKAHAIRPFLLSNCEIVKTL